jgi:hypothetical protein
LRLASKSSSEVNTCEKASLSKIFIDFYKMS